MGAGWVLNNRSTFCESCLDDEDWAPEEEKCDHRGDPCVQDGYYCNGLELCYEDTNRCPSEGYPSPEFLTALHPDLAGLYRDKLPGPVLGPGTRVGGLTAGWAARLGLRPGTPVAAPIIDAHAAVPGGNECNQRRSS